MADNADLDTTGQDRQARRIALWAIGCSVLACVAMLGISLRVLQLKTAPSDQLQALMGDPISTRPSVGRRGDLVDCRGRLLATSTIGWRAFIDPRLIEDLGTIGVELEALIGLDAIETDQKLNRRLHSRFVPVSGILEEWQVDRINSADLAGIGLERRLVRSYPQGSTAARLVGAVGFDHQGLGGLEHALEDQLLGQSGKLKYLRDVRNRPMWVASNGYEPHVDAPPVRLTIDLAIQRYLEERLQEAVDACNAGGGRAIVIDPETGETTRTPLTEADLARLTRLVQDAVGYDVSRGDSVSVINSPFVAQAEMVPLPEIPIWSQPWFWDVAKQILGVLFILILVFGVLRPVLKNLTTANRDNGAAGYPAEYAGSGGLDGDLRDDQVSLSGTTAGAAGAAMLLPSPGADYEQQLNAIKGLLAEDTGRVAQVVKEWINADE